MLAMEEGLEPRDSDRVLVDLGVGRALASALQQHASAAAVEEEERATAAAAAVEAAQRTTATVATALDGRNAAKVSSFGDGNPSHVRKCIRAAAMAFGYDDEGALLADPRFVPLGSGTGRRRGK